MCSQVDGAGTARGGGWLHPGLGSVPALWLLVLLCWLGWVRRYRY